MPTDIAHPIPLAPDPRPNADLRVQLHAHLKVPLKRRFRDLQRSTDTRIPLEPARRHAIVVSFLAGFLGTAGRGIEGRRGGTIDGLVEDWVFGVVLFHGG